ncbi:MAG: gamma-glutamyltransferase [Oceanipulchritudo sp.]
MMRCLAFPACLLLCLSPATAQLRYAPSEFIEFSKRAPVYAKNGMVATSQPLVSQIALQILKDGGNAVDAAIAANAAIGLMEPTGSGIGGDLFALVWSAEEETLFALNASGRAPLGISREKIMAQGYKAMKRDSPHSVTVPGTVDGWFMLHEKFGTVEMEDLLAPSIAYAEEGFPLSPMVGWLMEGQVRSLHEEGFPNIEATYKQEDGNWPGGGELFKNPMLANTYRQIAREGREAFYRGPIAEAIVELIQDQGGYLSMEDLARHHGDWVVPVSTSYRGYDLWEIPPNGQGIAALQILNILETFDFSGIEFGSAEHLHLFIEAKKLAYEDRARYYADPEYEEVPVDWLISKAYARERAQLIDMDRAGTFESGDLPAHGDTIYLTTADSAGNMVSLIQSNYTGMGGGMVPANTGFMLQNRGYAFSLKEGHRNVIEPGKRPFHTIIPAFVTKDGKPFFSYGVMGGSMQPQGHVQVLVNIVDFGMNPQEAGDAPRIRHEDSSSPEGMPAKGSGVVHLEKGFDAGVTKELYFKRHKIQETLFFGGYQGILWNDEEGVYTGATESRSDGQAVGY